MGGIEVCIPRCSLPYLSVHAFSLDRTLPTDRYLQLLKENKEKGYRGRQQNYQPREYEAVFEAAINRPENAEKRGLYLIPPSGHPHNEFLLTMNFPPQTASSRSSKQTKKVAAYLGNSQ